MPDTAQEVKAILSRTLRELDEAIANPSVSSVLTRLSSLLGVEGDSTAAPAAPASRKRGSGAARRSQSARSGPGASAARKSAPTPTRGRRSAPATDGAKPREATKSGSNGERKSSRRDDLLALVREQPGVTLAQAATRFGLKDSSSLYGVARRLQQEGLVRKAGPGLHPNGKAQKR